MKIVCLVSCVGKKAPTACEARDLYISQWFKKARQVAEAFPGGWFILSARHGLVRPDQVIEPYDQCMADLSVADRVVWSERVFHQIHQAVPDITDAVVFAGIHYRRPLQPMLVAGGITVRVPMEKMQIGEQLKWLTERIKS